MRKQIRPTLPTDLQADLDEFQTQWDAKHLADPDAPFTWYVRDGVNARDRLLEHLQALNQKHCSFCDGYPIEAFTEEPIEHFRPKSLFPEVAYQWENLFYICTGCNGNKNDKWHESLVKPDLSEYFFLTYFMFNQYGDIVENPTASEDIKVAARETIRVYGLNKRNRPSYRMEEFEKFLGGRLTIDSYSFRDFLEFHQTPLL
ncbi:MAG: hypothetical protein ACRC8S_09665 [Fimbriiglobus sp.]